MVGAHTLKARDVLGRSVNAASRIPITAWVSRLTSTPDHGGFVEVKVEAPMTTIDFGSSTYTIEMTSQRLLMHGVAVACLVDHEKGLIRVRRDLTPAQIDKAIRQSLLFAKRVRGSDDDRPDAVSLLEVIRSRRCERGADALLAEQVVDESLETALRQVRTYCDAVREMHDLVCAALSAEGEASDCVLQNTVRRLGQWTGADRSYFFRYEMHRGIQRNTHEWCGRGIEPQIDLLQSVPLSMTPMMNRAMWAGQSLRLHNVSRDIPTQFEIERGILLDQDICSLLMVPAYAGRRLAGFIGLDSVRRHRYWTGHEVDLLEIVGRLYGALAIDHSVN